MKFKSQNLLESNLLISRFFVRILSTPAYWVPSSMGTYASRDASQNRIEKTGFLELLARKRLGARWSKFEKPRHNPII